MIEGDETGIQDGAKVWDALVLSGPNKKGTRSADCHPPASISPLRVIVVLRQSHVVLVCYAEIVLSGQ